MPAGTKVGQVVTVDPDKHRGPDRRKGVRFFITAIHGVGDDAFCELSPTKNGPPVRFTRTKAIEHFRTTELLPAPPSEPEDPRSPLNKNEEPIAMSTTTTPDRWFTLTQQLVTAQNLSWPDAARVASQQLTPLDISLSRDAPVVPDDEPTTTPTAPKATAAAAKVTAPLSRGSAALAMKAQALALEKGIPVDEALDALLWATFGPDTQHLRSDPPQVRAGEPFTALVSRVARERHVPYAEAVRVASAADPAGARRFADAVQ